MTTPGDRGPGAAPDGRAAEDTAADDTVVEGSAVEGRAVEGRAVEGRAVEGTRAEGTGAGGHAEPEGGDGAWWAGDDGQSGEEPEVPDAPPRPGPRSRPEAGARTPGTSGPPPTRTVRGTTTRRVAGVGRAGATVGPRYPDDEDDGSPGLASLPPLPPSSRARRPRESWLPDQQSARTLSGPDIAGIVLLGAVGIAVLVVLGLFVLNRFDQRDPVAASVSPRAAVTVPASPVPGATTATTATSAPTPRPTSSPTPSADLGTPGRLDGVPYVGALDRRDPSGVTASCTDTPTQDDNGDTTYYDASQSTDNDPRTAWRCPGAGVGERLTLKFDQPTSVAELSIVNGWARKDGKTQRYYQYRRVQKVRWSFDGGRFVDQELDDHDPTPQTLRIPATVTSTVVVEIEDTGPAKRNATPISELAVAGPSGG